MKESDPTIYSSIRHWLWKTKTWIFLIVPFLWWSSCMSSPLAGEIWNIKLYYQSKGTILTHKPKLIRLCTKLISKPNTDLFMQTNPIFSGLKPKMVGRSCETSWSGSEWLYQVDGEKQRMSPCLRALSRVWNIFQFWFNLFLQQISL